MKTAAELSSQPIGIFDSGMGGLTVLKALQQRLPNESFVYLGDTARLPYGTKSQQAVINYATKMTDILLEENIKALVIACNTATAAALPMLQQRHPELTIIGVVEPGVQAAVQASQNHQYALLATETTIRSEIYQNKIYQQDPEAIIVTQACGLFVALAEENSIDDEVAYAAVKKYITPIINNSHHCDCIILGCTHFPVLIKPIRDLLGNNIKIVDSAAATAEFVDNWLNQRELNNASGDKEPSVKFLVTDNPDRFVRVGEVFLGQAIHNVDLR